MTATIRVGPFADGVAVDPAAGTVYVANSVGYTVSVIHAATRTVAATIPDGGNPDGVAVDPAAGTVYVTNNGAGTVSVIHAATSAVTATIPVGDGPIGVAVDPAAGTVYVADIQDSTVSVINAATHAVTATIPVGDGPFGVAVDAAAGTVYVTNYSGGTVSVINAATHAVTATIPVGGNPAGVAVDPAAGTVYVTNYSSGTVSVINAATHAVTATIPVGSKPAGVAVDPAAGTVYVTNQGEGTVSVIDAAAGTVTATIPVGTDPDGVAVDPATHTAYVANLRDGTVSVISAARAPTALTARIGLSPRLTLTATLTAAGQPLSGQPVSFSTGPTHLCTRDTSTRGVATCVLTLWQTVQVLQALQRPRPQSGPATPGTPATSHHRQPRVRHYRDGPEPGALVRLTGVTAARPGSGVCCELPPDGGGRHLEDDHRAGSLAALHRRVALVDLAEGDPRGDELIQAQAALAVEVQPLRYVDAEPVRAHRASAQGAVALQQRAGHRDVHAGDDPDDDGHAARPGHLEGLLGRVAAADGLERVVHAAAGQLAHGLHRVGLGRVARRAWPRGPWPARAARASGRRR